ncbi:MAG: DNA-processing protein DprA [Myxococcota bacterium]
MEHRDSCPLHLRPGDARWGNELWPTGLSALRRPPRELRVLGSIADSLGQRRVAIVGTRRADVSALDFAESLSRDLASLDACVVSGGALGIDAAAHRGALSAGGATWAVLPTGFAPCYPAQNQALFRRIQTSGALISELEDGAVPRPSRFIERNRLIAAFSHALVVVQAPLRSGALSTARVAMRLGVPVLAVPASPWDPRGAGGLALLGKGAKPCLGPRSITDTFTEPLPQNGPQLDLNSISRLEPDEFSGSTDLESSLDASLPAEDREVLLACVGRSISAEELSLELTKPIHHVQRVLLALMLRELLVEESPGHFRSVKRSK